MKLANTPNGTEVTDLRSLIEAFHRITVHDELSASMLIVLEEIEQRLEALEARTSDHDDA